LTERIIEEAVDAPVLVGFGEEFSEAVVGVIDMIDC
jgi:hypothetical protein